MGNTININGKLYDSDTGEPVGKAKSNQSTKKSTTAHKLLRPKSRQNTTEKTTSKAQSSEKTPGKPAKRAHTQAVNASSKLQRTQTLRRKQLTRPTKKVNSKQTTTPKPLSEASKASPKPRSADTKRSPLISKFNSATTRRSSIDSIGPVAANPKQPSQAKPTSKVKKKATPTNKPQLSAKDELIYKKMAELEDQKPVSVIKRHSRKVKLTIIAIAAVAVLLIGAFLIYTRIPDVSVWLASRQSGFEAVLPHYTPDGFHYSAPVKHKSDQITITFRSNTDDRHYSIIEQPTQWDPEAVYDNYVKKHGNEPPYTINDSGLTIYIFNNNTSAAWVNGGNFFVIDGTKAELSPNQLQQIATSL